VKNGSGVRGSFVRAFGEDTASRIEAAASEHSNGVNSERKGDDPFKWALLICIGYQCMEKPDYRTSHGIEPPWPKLKAWIKKNGELRSHNGDCDYLALVCGTYNEFMPKRKKQSPAKQTREGEAE
jgi:hypothetical protein